MVKYTSATDPELTLTFLDEVEPKEVEWLWPGRIPIGKLTILAGDPGLGKSYLALDIIARVSTADSWPDGGNAIRSHVFILSAEDDLEDTIRPRLDVLNADPSWVIAIDPALTSTGNDGEIREALSLSEHLNLLEKEILLYKSRLLVLDPILAFTGSKTDTHKSADVRRALAPLAKIAQNTKCAILAVMHLNKKSTETNSIYRVTGSLDFAAAARSVLLVGKDPNDPEARILASSKSNLSALPSSLRYRMSDGGFAWDGEVDINADSLLDTTNNDGQVAGALAEAEEFLCDILDDGPMPTRQVIREANKAGIKEHTLKRAKKKLRIESKRVGQEGDRGRGHWSWILPPVK